MAIDIRDVRFSYGDKEILKGVDARIPKGKLTGILGPNGCGKSTLLKNILGYLKKNQGDIKIAGREIRDYTGKELARTVALVPQKSNLMSPMNVEEFVIMGRLPHMQNPWQGYSRGDRKISEKFMEEMDISQFKGRGALSLSGGEFQRVLLARALTQDPQILLLDEPTSAMDLNHAVELMSSVKKKVKEKEITSVAVIHDLNLASMFCDELILMLDGRVRYVGTPREVLTEERLKEVYNLKSRVITDDEGNPYVIPLV